MPIYWLNGTKAADDYEDFYDGDWDDEANDKNASGNDSPRYTPSSNNWPLDRLPRQRHRGAQLRQ